MSRIVMIHEVTPELLKKDLSNFDIITFDDGLYSQYLNHEHFAKFNKRMIFFISTNIICPENIKQSPELISCAESHKKAFKGNFENYMNISQILELNNLYEIGGHGHNHIKFKNSIYSYKEYREDTNSMFKLFNQLNIQIKSFCLPYNQENSLYKAYLKSLGLEIFGNERIPIEAI